MKALSTHSMGGTFRPRTEGRHEPRRSHVLNELFRPAHDRPEQQSRGRKETTERLRFVVRLLSAPSGRGHCGPSLNQQACGHRGGGVAGSARG